MAGYVFTPETGLYILDSIESVALTGKTLVVDMVVFILLPQMGTTSY